MSPAGPHAAVTWMKDNAFKQVRAGSMPPLLINLEHEGEQAYVPDPASSSATGRRQAERWQSETANLSVILVVPENFGDPNLMHVIAKSDIFGNSVVDCVSDESKWQPLLTSQATTTVIGPSGTKSPPITFKAPARSEVVRIGLPKTWLGVPQRFMDWLKELRINGDLPAAADLVSAFLSSQFLLFAGQSGTGKSTLARAVVDYFTPQIQSPSLTAAVS